MTSLSEKAHKMTKDAYTNSLNSGWWTNLETGEKLDRRNAETYALIRSELDEMQKCTIYYNKGIDIYDDHLPHLYGQHVECADVLLRVCDYMGGYDYFNEKDFSEYNHCLEFPEFISNRDEYVSTMGILWSEAFEAFRKGQIEKEKTILNQLVSALYHYAIEFGFDLDKIARDKMLYNSRREDHKIENRKKDGGKKI